MQNNKNNKNNKQSFRSEISLWRKLSENNYCYYKNKMKLAIYRQKLGINK